jgi:hypothetical protein
MGSMAEQPKRFRGVLPLLLVAAAMLLLSVTAFDPTVGGSSRRATSPLEKRAEGLEGRLAESPGDRRLLRATTQAWIAAGNARLARIDTRTQPIPSAVNRALRTGLRVWNRYLRETKGEADADIAEQAGDTFFKLVEIGSTNPEVAKANAAGAARALRIAGKHRPTLYTLSNLAIYEYFNGRYAAGDRAGAGAAAAGSRAEARVVWDQLDEYRERGERFVGQVRGGMRALAESGRDELKEPIKGYGSPAGINRTE